MKKATGCSQQSKCSYRTHRRYNTISIQCRHCVIPTMQTDDTTILFQPQILCEKPIIKNRIIYHFPTGYNTPITDSS